MMSKEQMPVQKIKTYFKKEATISGSLFDF